MQKEAFFLDKFYRQLLFDDSGKTEETSPSLSNVFSEFSGSGVLLRQMLWIAYWARPATLADSASGGINDSLSALIKNECISVARSIKKLLKIIHKDKLEPRPDLVSDGFCLAWEKNEYLIYLPWEQEIGVQLPFGDKLRYRWFDPASGAFQPWNMLKSRRPARFQPPFEDGSVLLIQAPSLSNRAQKIGNTKFEEGPL